MATYLYRLTFLGPVHFGTTGVGLENSDVRLRSDGLTSALINAFAVLGEADDTVAALKAERPAFVLSSLFPFGLGTNGPVYGVPRPLLTPPLSQEDSRAMGKEIKKVAWISPKGAGAWLGERSLSVSETKAMLVDPKDWWKDDLRPRVALDRDSQNSQIWLCGTVTFAKGCGPYGLVQVNDETWKSRLEAAFRVLGDLADVTPDVASAFGIPHRVYRSGLAFMAPE